MSAAFDVAVPGSRLDEDAAYRVLLARDARYDGQLYVGVTSTGIYCRPICRVKAPKAANCRFFQTAAQAEAAAFRPCLKCRPELAPGRGDAWSVMDASRTLARQAADWLDGPSAQSEPLRMTAIAARLGVSERHLRRIFQAEHGVTPIQYLQTRRLLLAKTLLTDSMLPIGEVALASGFRSLRRFNAAFVGNYRMSPSRLRGVASGRPATAASRISSDRTGVPSSGITVTLGYRPPYAVDALMRFFERRAVPGVEQVEARRVRRTVRAGTLGDTAGLPGMPGWLEATFLHPAPQVRLRFSAEWAPCSALVIAAVRRWFDLDAAPHAIDAALMGLPGLPGQRLPGSADPFELAVRAILGQQVTVAAARTLARRLVLRFGTPVETPWTDVHTAFPSPQALAVAPLDAIGELGVVGSRAKAIQALALAWPTLGLEGGFASRPVDMNGLIARLCALPGVGPWTAHYIAMRALGWPDGFPPGDVALAKALAQQFQLTDAAAISRQTAQWQPWRSYAVMRLWASLETP